MDKNNHLDVLQAELARLDVLLKREIRKWQRAGQDPQDAFRGLYVSDHEVSELLDRPFATNWGNVADPDPEEAAKFSAAYARAEDQASLAADQLRETGVEPRLDRLTRIFGLDAFSRDILLICLAPILDLRYERIYGYLQDDVTRKLPSINLILNLLAPAGAERLDHLTRFTKNSRLFSHQIVQEGPNSRGAETTLLNRTLTIDPAVLSWLLGDYQPAGLLKFAASLEEPKFVEELNILAEVPYGRSFSNFPPQPILALAGPDLLRQEATARLWAAAAVKPLLTILLPHRSADPETLLEMVQLARRDACLLDAVLYFQNWDACLENGKPLNAIAQQIYQHAETVILGAVNNWLPNDHHRDRTIINLDFQVPEYSQRLEIWNFYLKKILPDHGFDLAGLAGQFALTAGQIRASVASASDYTQQRGGEITREDLFAGARAHSNPRLATLAQKINPRFDWSDIVLPGDQLLLLQEIVNTVQQRPQVLDDWGVGSKLSSSRGVTILFAGPPGTGKTMAAEIISGELGLDLFKIDLSTVVSKYIGETEKNLERIFREATSSNAILFFDEADALFGKRSEVRDSHDRYANIEISYLLQRMEAYDGVTILATNLRANLDEAFTRRLQFAVDFPFPEAEDRHKIWQTLFPPGVPRSAGIDLHLLANRFRLAGGNIRNIIVNAAYLASADGGQVNMEHLLHGTRRELQKMGRLVDENHMSVRKNNLPREENNISEDKSGPIA